MGHNEGELGRKNCGPWGVGVGSFGDTKKLSSFTKENLRSLWLENKTHIYAQKLLKTKPDHFGLFGGLALEIC